MTDQCGELGQNGTTLQIKNTRILTVWVNQHQILQ